MKKDQRDEGTEKEKGGKRQTDKGGGAGQSDIIRGIMSAMGFAAVQVFL